MKPSIILAGISAVLASALAVLVIPFPWNQEVSLRPNNSTAVTPHRPDPVQGLSSTTQGSILITLKPYTQRPWLRLRRLIAGVACSRRFVLALGPYALPLQIWIPSSPCYIICLVYLKLRSVIEIRGLIWTSTFLGRYHHSNNSPASHDDNHHNLFANTLWLCCLSQWSWGGVSVRACLVSFWGHIFFPSSNTGISTQEPWSHSWVPCHHVLYFLSDSRLLSNRTGEQN